MRIDITTPLIDKIAVANVLPFKRVLPLKEVLSVGETHNELTERDGDTYTSQLISFLEERRKRRKSKQENAFETYKAISKFKDQSLGKTTGLVLSIKV